MARSEIGLSEALVGAADYAAGIEAAMGAHREAVAMENDEVLWRALTAEARAIRRVGDGPRALGVSRAAIGALDRLEAAAQDRPGASLPRTPRAPWPPSPSFRPRTAIRRARSRRPSACTPSNCVRRWRPTSAKSAGMTAEEHEEERRLASQVATFIARIARERGLPKPDAVRIAALNQSLAGATAERRTWMRGLFERLPDLARWRGLAPFARPDARAFVGPEALLLSFVLDDQDFLVLAVTAPPAAAPADDGRRPGKAVAIEAHVVPLKRRQIATLSATLQHPTTMSIRPRGGRPPRS